MVSLATQVFARQDEERDEQLVHLFRNRTELKKQLESLRRDSEYKADQLRQQEATALRARQRLEQLEDLLGDPERAYAALVFYQLRGAWNSARRRVRRLSRELTAVQEKRERERQVAGFERARQRELAVIDRRLSRVVSRSREVDREIDKLNQQLQELRGIWNFRRRQALKPQMDSLDGSRQAISVQLERLSVARRDKEEESAPSFPGLSLEGRRCVNLAAISLAQEIYIHFHSYGVAALARESVFREVLDVDYGDQKEARALRKRIRDCVQTLDDDEAMAQRVHRRAEALQKRVEYLRDSDSVPSPDGLEEIVKDPSADYSDSLSANVLLDEYWEIHSVLLT